MSQQYSWPTHSWPLEGRCLYYALLGLTQAPGFAGGPDLQGGHFHDDTAKSQGEPFHEGSGSPRLFVCLCIVCATAAQAMCDGNAVEMRAF